MDTDTNVEDGDDYIFLNNVDLGATEPEIGKNRKKAAGSRLGRAATSVRQSKPLDSNTDEEELELPKPKAGEGGVRLRFKSFIPEDINNPTSPFLLECALLLLRC